MIHKAGQLGWFCFEFYAAMTYPATLIILGLKASTCFRRVFIVFPVPTIACKVKDRKTRLRKQKIANKEMQTKNRLISHCSTSQKEEVGHTVFVLHNCS